VQRLHLLEYREVYAAITAVFYKALMRRKVLIFAMFKHEKPIFSKQIAIQDKGGYLGKLL